MKIKVRFAQNKDLPKILEILNYEILNSTAIYDYDEKTPEELLDWFAEKQRKGMPLIVAEKDNDVVGYGTYGDFRDKIGYRLTVEHSVYIAKNHRRKGIGGLILKELVEIAKKEGLHIMIAGLDGANMESFEFHKKHGFKEVGTFKEVGFKFDQWLDVTFMQLNLDE
jgi:phosphinothricin acetyltransferase